MSYIQLIGLVVFVAGLILALSTKDPLYLAMMWSGWLVLALGGNTRSQQKRNRRDR